MGTLAGQTAIVTGASSGVGRSIALELAAAGMTVALIGRDRQRLQEVASAAQHQETQLHCFMADLGDGRELEMLSQQLSRQFPQLGALVHSAGLINLGPLDITSPEQLDAQYRVNLRAPYVLTQHLLPALRAQPGQIVFLNSSLGIQSRPEAGSYSATKHGLRALADSLRGEVNPHSVRVLSVYLGQTATPMQAQLYAQTNRPYAPERLIQPQEAARLIRQLLELGPSCEVTDIHIRPMLKP